MKYLEDNMYSFLEVLSCLTSDIDSHGQSKHFCLSSNKAVDLWWKTFIFVYAFQMIMFDAHNFRVLPHKQI